VGQCQAAGVCGPAFTGHFLPAFVALPPQPDDLEQARLLALQIAGLKILVGTGGFGSLRRADIERLPDQTGGPLTHEPGALAPEGDISRGGKERGSLVGRSAGDLDQAAIRLQIADKDVARLDEGATSPLEVPVAAWGVGRSAVNVRHGVDLTVFQVDPVEVAGLLAGPLAQEVDAAAVATPVRSLRLAPQPVRVGHDPLETQVILSLDGKREQETRRQDRAGGRRKGYSRYCSISRAVGASA